MKKQKLGCGWLILIQLVGLILMVIAFIQLNDDYSNYKATDQNVVEEQVSKTSEELKEFDSNSWEQFKTLYDNHNKLKTAYNYYDTGKISKITFYNFCKNFYEATQSAPHAFNYGTTEDEKTYLEDFRFMAFRSNWAANSFMKYLDGYYDEDDDYHEAGEIGILSDALDYLEEGSKFAENIISNRGTRLKNAGYTDEEITKITNNIPTELKGLGKINLK